jgi:hypothetical protein
MHNSHARAVRSPALPHVAVLSLIFSGARTAPATHRLRNPSCASSLALVEGAVLQMKIFLGRSHVKRGSEVTTESTFSCLTVFSRGR